MPSGDPPEDGLDVEELDYDGWLKTVYKDGPVIFANQKLDTRITVESTSFNFGRESHLVTRHDRNPGGEMWPKAQRTADSHHVAGIVYEEMENAESDAGR